MHHSRNLMLVATTGISLNSKGKMKVNHWLIRSSSLYTEVNSLQTDALAILHILDTCRHSLKFVLYKLGN